MGLRMVFIFLNGCKKERDDKKKQNSATPKVFLLHLLWKTFADP